MLLQLDPPLWFRTERGNGWAHFLIDRGQEHDLEWVMFMDDTGECWTVTNKLVRLGGNWTMEAPRNGEFSKN